MKIIIVNDELTHIGGRDRRKHVNEETYIYQFLIETFPNLIVIITLTPRSIVINSCLHYS